MKKKPFKGKNIVVTGGEGFIGKNLVKKLKQEWASVIIFDQKNNIDLCNL